MTSVIIGYGQIGKAVYSVISKTDKIYIYDKKRERGEYPAIVDVMHVCFPYEDEDFIQAVKDYIKEFKPFNVVIWSTVPIGTTKHIKGAVHSPVEGVHPNLDRSIKNMVRWVGANDATEAMFFEDYFKKMLLKVKVVPSSNFTELLKLRSTAKYGVNLVWTDYENHLAEKYGMDFEYLKEFDKDYNRLYHNLGMDWAQRYILNPPGGHIGGHCVVPNAKLLDKQNPHEMLKMIKDME